MKEKIENTMSAIVGEKVTMYEIVKVALGWVVVLGVLAAVNLLE